MRTKLTVKLLTLFLLLSQFVTLTHAFEHHSVTDDHSSCLVFHVNDHHNTIPVLSLNIDVPFAGVDRTCHTHSLYDLKPLLQQNIRGPPLVLQ